MIIFKNLKWRNFLSTGAAFTEIQLDKSNTTLIVGENGSGKSTMLDALSFALYNKPFRKINKPQLLNSINKKELVVEVEFSIGSTSYRIVRGIKPTVFEVYQNDNLLNQNAESKDYQEILETQILKLNHKSFCQVVVLGSASFTPFMQLAAQARREVIEDLLDIQIFSTMNSLLKDDIVENNKALQQAEYDYSLTTNAIEMQNLLASKMRDNTVEQIEKIDKEITLTDAALEMETFKIVHKDIQIGELLISINDEAKIRNKHQKLLILEQQLLDKITKLKSDISFFDNHDNCPTCKQVIQNDFKCDNINEKRDELDSIDSGIVHLKTKLYDVESEIKQIDSIKKDITNLKIEQAAHINTANGHKAYIIKLAKNKEELNKKSDDPVSEETIKKLEIQLQDNIEQKNELARCKDSLLVAALILKDSGIKSRIIKQYVPVINKLINKYLSAMDFFVQFELDETFNEKIKSRFRDEFSYSSFSEGEKMRINLAILFTWRAVAKMRNSASTNILIMDEVMDSSLDVNGTNEFMKILTNLTNDTNTFIISHKTDQLFDKFNQVIKFEKSQNFSRIV